MKYRESQERERERERTRGEREREREHIIVFVHFGDRVQTNMMFCGQKVCLNSITVIDCLAKLSPCTLPDSCQFESQFL